MKRCIILLAVIVVLFSACNGLPFFEENEINLYVSISESGLLPAPYTDLAQYGGKTVRFSVTGIDAVNNDIILEGTDEFEWTGGDPASSTQYADYQFKLENTNGNYPGGSFKFIIFIDWDGDGTFNTGDIYMQNYSVIIDKDNNPDTDGISENTELHADIVYDDTDHSITIEDPLTNASGFQWIVEDIHEGDLAVKD